MKRLFLFTMMCLFGLFGSLNAQTQIDLYVGSDGTTYGHNNLPTYEYYNYSISQQIYTAEEMQELAGTITSIAFRQTDGLEDSRNLSVYLQNTTKDAFSSSWSNWDWVSLSEENLVFSGQVAYPALAGGWMTLEFQTPFEYTGENLLVCVVDNTGKYTTGRKFDAYEAEQGTIAMYTYKDDAPFDVANISKQPNTSTQKNVAKFDVTIQGEYKTLTIKPNNIDLGPRPNGAWMRPYEVTVGTRGTALNISAVETTNSYFQLPEVEYPVEITKGNPLVLALTHGEAEGNVTGQLTVFNNETRDIEIVDMAAFAYTPVASDVWETATAITSYPFSATPDMATTYDNYLLPGSAEDGKDVVYEMNFNNDVVLTANVEGANGKIAVYTEDFGGKEGPMADNNYNGPQVNTRANEINEMVLPAGKYYIAASSTSEFTVNINAVTISAPEKAYNPDPVNGAQNVSNPTLNWTFGANTIEYQVLIGTAYPPQEVVVDWTDNLEVGHQITDLYNNRNYFWQVNARNSSGTTYGDIWVFTTTFNAPTDLAATSTKLYEGESTTLSWTAVQDRGYRGYNVYVGGEKVNESLVTETSYTIDDLAYNMSWSGHKINVTAVYDEGESEYSNSVYVYVTGMTEITGNVYEQDGVTPIGGGTILLNGTDEIDNPVTYTFQVDETGVFSGEILAGDYIATATIEGYQNAEVEFTAVYGELATIDFNVTEVYNPVKFVKATEVDSIQSVFVEWGMQYYGTPVEDFETGDFSSYEWNNEASDYPWVIVEGGCESQYAMRSNCAGVDDGVSAIEITMEVPYNGMIGFNYKISSEAAYDLGKFYIDGVEMASFSGVSTNWGYRQVAVTEGVHTYRWEYAKDIMWEDGDDAFYVDNITFYFQPEPFAGGWLHYDDGVYNAAIGLNQPAPVYWAVAFPASEEYAGYTIDKLMVYDAPGTDSGVADYGNATVTAGIYLGGESAPGTLVSTAQFTMTGAGDFVEITLDTPVAIDGTQTFWIQLYCDALPFPAAGTSYCGDSNSDWISLDGTEWEHALDSNLEVSWMIRANMSNAKGQTMTFTTASKALKFQGGASTGTLAAAENVKAKYVGVPSDMTTAEGTRAFSAYNFYKKSLYGEQQLLLEKTLDTAYIDNTWATAEPGVYQWGVSAIYEGNRGSAVVFSEDFEGGALPTGWSTYYEAPDWFTQYYGEVAAWYIGDKIPTSYDFSYSAGSGNYSAFSNSGDGYIYGVKSSIITPAIQIRPDAEITFIYTNPAWGSDISEINVYASASAEGPWTNKIWSTNNTSTTQNVDDWRNAQIDLSEFAGSTIYLAFEHKASSSSYYGYAGMGVGIDDIVVTAAMPESEILWSKPIDKNMYTKVTVTAGIDSQDDPIKGTKVTFTNIVEEGIVYTATMDETGTVVFDNFRKGTYELVVAKNGFTSSINGDIVGVWDEASYNAFLTENLAAVEGLYVSPTGWAMWEGAAVGTGDEFAYGFDEGLDGWTTIDGNGDGHNWYHSSECEASHAVLMGDPHSGAGHICSESYCNALGALNPDDYVVTPEKVAIGSSSVLRFWASAQDDEWAAEHFGVAVSTDGNTSGSDFTTIAEWTIGQKKGNAETRELRQTAWTQYEVDLSEYAGQEVYIAIRHFNVSDMFMLLVDDVELINAEKATRSLLGYTVLLDGDMVAEGLTVPYYQHENLTDSIEYTTTVIANYSMGDSEEMTYTWTKAQQDIFATVTNLKAEKINDQAVLTWVLPVEATTDADTASVISTFFTDFESGYKTWPMLDADGDGFNWVYSTDYEDVNAYSGTNCMYSESYCNQAGAGALEPDNYLIIPSKIAVEEGTTLSFYARAQDENYPEEGVGVAVSTSYHSSDAYFTTIAEWIIAEDDKQANADRSVSRGTPWTKYEIDLSDYAGQEIWVAIRHFNCYNEFRLNIDDVAVTVNSDKSREGEGTWAYYDDGICVDGIGGPTSFSWGIKLRSADIADLGALTKVSIFDRVATSGTFDICLGGDNAPGASVLNQAYTLTGVNDFVEFALTETVDPAGQNVWIIFNTTEGHLYPASECANTGDADGRWIYLESDGWFDVLTGAGLDATWMIRGYFEVQETVEEPNTAIAEVLGVMIYRNGELISNKVIEGETYTDKKGTKDDEYCVKVVYGGELDVTYYAMSETSCAVTTYDMPCVAPKNLYGEAYSQGGEYGARLVWPYTDPNAWMYYDDGTFVSALGTGGGSFYWGIMFPTDVLTQFAGRSLTQVSMFDYKAHTGNFLIYTGGTTAPGTLVHTEPYVGTASGDFVSYELSEPVAITGTENIWVVVCNDNGDFPAAYCAFTGDANGSWISLDGTAWSDVADPNIYGEPLTWMVRAYAGYAKGETTSVEPIEFNNIATGGTLMATNEPAGSKAPTLSHYNIYRGTSANNFELIGESEEGEYFDAINEEGTFFYQVTAVYEEEGETCESEPATSYNSSDKYVVVDVVSIDENGVSGMMVYPNPTKDKLTITAENMTRITITNALGQVMYDTEVVTDNEVIDMAQYEAGVYMVRITTESGVATERVTVVR